MKKRKKKRFPTAAATTIRENHKNRKFALDREWSELDEVSNNMKIILIRWFSSLSLTQLQFSQNFHIYSIFHVMHDVAQKYINIFHIVTHFLVCVLSQITSSARIKQEKNTDSQQLYEVIL